MKIFDTNNSESAVHRLGEPWALQSPTPCFFYFEEKGRTNRITSRFPLSEKKSDPLAFSWRFHFKYLILLYIWLHVNFQKFKTPKLPRDSEKVKKNYFIHQALVWWRQVAETSVNCSVTLAVTMNQNKRYQWQFQFFNHSESLLMVVSLFIYLFFEIYSR